MKTAFTAKMEMSWGDDIPEDIFRHFVLPLRVNNENLDSARTVFYGELKDRVREKRISASAARNPWTGYGFGCSIRQRVTQLHLRLMDNVQLMTVKSPAFPIMWAEG